MKISCEHCGKLYSHKGIATHIWRSHGDGQKHNAHKDYVPGTFKGWSKGLTKDTDARLADIGKKVSKTTKGRPGRVPDKEERDKISESMKKAHEEGRAWNIGQSRWNNEPSWPEKWFMSVIRNEELDPNYIQEMPFGKYSLDFAWVDLKKCIEIDGDQHERCEKQKARDVAKDALLSKQGWQVLRLRWKDVCSDSKGNIEKAKTFLSDELGGHT